jgi:hypothetical protein
MKIVRIILAIIVTATSLIMLTGCKEKSPYDTSIPWSRPADWENQLPGVGNPGA